MINRVLLLGFDGADWNKVYSFMGEGELPNFQKLMENGVSGPLRSTIPPLSPPAWTSMVTGVNPGKHGVFEFFKFDRRTFEKKIEFNPIKTKKIWDYLDEESLRSIIINFPLMYPPEKVNGITVSGLMTPSSAKYFTYPKHLSRELIKEGYEVEIHEEELFKLLHSDMDALFRRLMENMEKRAKTSLGLLNEHKWDFSMVVFGESDRIQHFFWNDKSLILKCYKKMDEILGNFLRFMDDDTVMMVVSDHGFKGIKKYFYINSWLAKKGFLSLKKEVGGRINREEMLGILGRLHLNCLLKYIPSKIGKRVSDSKLRTSNNVSKLIIATPSSSSEWQKMSGGFQDLYLMVEIDFVTLCLPDIPVVKNGVSTINPGGDSAWWEFQFQEGEAAYYSYIGGGSWNPQVWNPLKPGNHTVYVTVTGGASIPAQQVNLDVTLYLEIRPA